MRKFWVLFKKEVKEIVTVRMVLPLVIMTFMFAFIGQVISGEQEKINKPINIGVLNMDSGKVFDEFLSSVDKNRFAFHKYDGDLEDALTESKKFNDEAFLYIDNSFSTDFNSLNNPKIEFYTFLKSFSFISTMQSTKIDGLKVSINNYLSDRAITTRLADTDPQKLKNPSRLADFIVLNDKMANISFQSVVGFIQSQTTFVPIILFLIIVIASQMVATTIASEKENKSFEILLSSPLNRKTIVLAKIFASGFMALVFAAFYMLGLSYYMKGVSGGAVDQMNPAYEALSQLGVIITPVGYVLIGMSLFLAILSALVIAIILGTMAEDVKSVQAVTTPLMILILLPYFVTMFLDLSSVPVVLKYIVYAIPFSYPFLSIQKVIMGEFSFIIYGLVYQLIFFGTFVFIAAKVFTSDLILTWKFKFRKKKLS